MASAKTKITAMWPSTALVPAKMPIKAARTAAMAIGRVVVLVIRDVPTINAPR